jgi:hypothetical protein
MNKQAGTILKKYGVKFEIGRPAGLGGGGALTIIELLKQLWHIKDYIGFLFLIIKTCYKYLTAFLLKDNPRVNVNLYFETKSDLKYVEPSDLEWIIISNMINLKSLSDEICKQLKKTYPIFLFDQSFAANIYDFSFRINYHLKDEYRNKINKYRITNLFKKISIKKNKEYNYDFKKFIVIEEWEDDLKIDHGIWMNSSKRKYSHSLS